MEPKSLNQPSLRNQKFNDQLLNSENKRPFNLNDIIDAAQKQASTRTFLLSQENLISNSRVYQKYLKNYYKTNNLYFFVNDKIGSICLTIYDTKSKQERIIDFKEYKIWIHDSTCIAPLPNGNLFCFGSCILNFGFTFLIDNDFKLHELPSGREYNNSSAIYYNRSVYCFGGKSVRFDPSLLSMRFDLDQNRWIKLSPIPNWAENCNTVIFNGKILISSPRARNLWVYSIDIDSFSIVPYDFELAVRVIINAGERVYLIECDNDWPIYESDNEDEFSWKFVSKWQKYWIKSVRACCAYNEGNFYIGFDQYKWISEERHYYKFNLKEKVLRTNSQWCSIF